MSLADYDAYDAALRLNRAADWQMSAAVSRTLRPNALWRSFLPAPANPTTSVAVDSNSDVALGPIPAVTGGNELCVLGGRFNTSGAGGMSVCVIDLLNHHAGMSGIVTTEQTTNLPSGSTAALTRYTSGEGVMIGLVVYTIIGTTATTVTVRYTNSSGVANRTSTATTFGGTLFREGGSLIPIPLQAGDTGVRSVEGVTLAATTGTAGNFGVSLFKPLGMYALNDASGTMPLDAVSTGGVSGQLSLAPADACLTLIGTGASAQSINGTLLLTEV